MLFLLAPKGELKINMEDEITKSTLLIQGGIIVNEKIREMLGPLANRSSEET